MYMNRILETAVKWYCKSLYLQESIQDLGVYNIYLSFISKIDDTQKSFYESYFIR